MVKMEKAVCFLLVEGESFTGPYCDIGLIHRWGLYTLARMAGVEVCLGYAECGFRVST